MPLKVETVRKTVDYTVHVTREELLRLLRNDLRSAVVEVARPTDVIKQDVDIPDNAEITVTVPTGGDYSGSDIALGEEFPYISVCWRVP